MLGNVPERAVSRTVDEQSVKDETRGYEKG